VKNLGKCILIVDDYEQVRRAIRSTFEASADKYECCEAVDGLGAIEKAQQRKPDLIVLDLSMPRMNGIEAAPRLKKMFPETPIVLLTSHNAALGNFDVSAVGIDAVIGKSGDFSVLAESLRDLLERGVGNMPPM
jgi:two-component system nitrogen regulation response regulator NtrX